MTAKFLTTPPGKRIRLADIDPRKAPGIKSKERAQKVDSELQERLRLLQQRLTAQAKHAVLVVCQGMDASGKDGLIRHVMGAFDPQGVEITPFKVPTPLELAHDFLWRIHRAVPQKGVIGIFNRSHYEDVGVVRVKKLVPETVWKTRYRQINDFEHMLSDNGVTVIKLFLHISPAEQAKRLDDRQHDPEEQWKFNPGDLEDRKLWGEFMTAYSDALTQCNTSWAPWHVIPADRKWYRNWAVSKILIEALEDLGVDYPAAAPGVGEYTIPEVEWP